MARIDNWQIGLTAFLEEFSCREFVWGKSDCMQLALGAVKAVTGQAPYPGAKGYRTEKGALKVLKRHGFDDAEQALAAAFDEVPVSMTGRGDIGVVDSDEGPAAVVCVGVHFVCMAPKNGFINIPRASVRRAFRVE